MTPRERRIDAILIATLLEMYGPVAKTLIWRASLPAGPNLTRQEFEYFMFNWRLSHDQHPQESGDATDAFGVPFAGACEEA